ncbi:hypothetical protein E2C01_081926 [Portunus trituberculatus]|uniref:Uncharacterized protein n=1 Tax=Portunus trituberculatus TaxID=210409 RepID=A0A5B7IZF0_PORTR|nr:hypothetical protein [Portunus trituberculatus]
MQKVHTEVAERQTQNMCIQYGVSTSRLNQKGAFYGLPSPPSAITSGSFVLPLSVCSDWPLRLCCTWQQLSLTSTFLKVLFL